MLNADNHSKSFVVLLSCALFACNPQSDPPDNDDTDNTDDTEENCPLDANARMMIEETVNTEALITSWVLDSAGTASVGFGVNLAGTELTQMSMVSMMMPCMMPSEFDFTCTETDIDSELLQCTRASCYEPNVWAAETWYADLEHEESVERHGLSWDASRFSGTGSTPENPVVKWFSDVNDWEAPIIWAETSHQFSVDIDGKLYDNSYDFAVRASHGHSASSLDLDLTFPSLSSEGEVELAFDSDGVTHAGSVELDGSEVATLGLGNEGAIVFNWTGDCAGTK